MDSSGLGTSAILAIILVPVVSLLKRPGWRSEINYLIGMAAALICALVGGLVSGDLTTQGMAGYFASALAASQTVYQLYFASSDLEKTLNP